MSWNRGNHAGLVRLPDGRALYLSGAGPERKSNNDPAVIIEHGLGGSVVEWLAVQRVVAQFARVYVYERAGYAPSDAPSSPPTARNIAADLKSLLQTADVRPPYVLVGHSLGGLLVRQFLNDFGKDVEVAGMVLVDPAPSGHPFPDGLNEILEKVDYHKVLGLDANHNLPADEYEQSKLNDERSASFAELEVQGKRTEVVELSEQIGSSALLGDARLSVIFCDRATDFRTCFHFAVQNDIGSAESRGPVSEWLETFSQLDEDTCRKHLSLSRNSRFVYAEGVRKTHNVQLVDPAWVAAEIQWVCGKE